MKSSRGRGLRASALFLALALFSWVAIAAPRPRPGSTLDLWRGAYTYFEDAGTDSGPADSGADTGADSGADSGSSDVDSGADAGDSGAADSGSSDVDSGADVDAGADVDSGSDAGATDADGGISGDTGEYQIVIAVTQSLGIGAGGGDAGQALTTSQVYALQRWADGGLGPLLENRDDTNGGSTPKVEQPTSAELAEVVALTNAQTGGLWWDAIAIVEGRSGAPYSELRYQGSGSESGADAGFADAAAGTGYSWWRAEQSLTAVCAAVAPRACKVVALVWVQCEAEQYYGHTQEAATQMAQIKSDSERFVSITGQSAGIPLIMSQCNSATGYGHVNALEGAAQLAAHSPDAGIYLAAPRSYPRIAASEGDQTTDTKHLTAAGYRTLGTDIGAFLAELFSGSGTEPLRPSSWSADGSVIQLNYAGCTPPMVIDHDAGVSLANLDNEGFRLRESGGRTISAVGVDGGCAVYLQASGTAYNGTRAEYAASCPRYASAADAGADAGVPDSGDDSTCEGVSHGRLAGMRGTIHDSAGKASWFGGTAVNKWAVAFGPGFLPALTGAASSPPLEVTHSIDLDGTGDYLSRADESALDVSSSKFGVCVWHYPQNLATHQTALASKSTNGDCSWGFYLGINGRLFGVVCASAGDDSGTNNAFTAIDTVTVNAWSFDCMTYDGSASASSRFAFYHNGSSVSKTDTGTPPATVRNSAAAYRIGQFRDGNDGTGDTNERTYNGRMSNHVYWSGATPTATAISDLYNSGAPRDPVGVDSGAVDANLVLWLRLGDGYVTSAGTYLGTTEGYSGICTSSGINTYCATASKLPIVIESAAGAIHNSAPGNSSLRFTVNGGPTFPAVHP